MQSIVLITLVIFWLAAFVDLKTFKIPNFLVAIGFFAALAARIGLADSGGLADGVLGLIVAFVLLLPIYLVGQIGSGDVKLAGVAGVFLGASNFAFFMIYTILIAGVLSVFYILMAHHQKGSHYPRERYGQMLRLFWTSGRLSYIPPVRGEAMAERLPLAVPIALSVTALIFWPIKNSVWTAI